MRPLILVALCLTLAACGADVATATVTTAKLQAEQAKQAQATVAQVRQKLDASNQVMEQRAADMAEEKR